jgi:hypothetical protein
MCIKCGYPLRHSTALNVEKKILSGPELKSKLIQRGSILLYLLLARSGFLLGTYPVASKQLQLVEQEALFLELCVIATAVALCMFWLRMYAMKWRIPQAPLFRWLLGYLMFFLGMQLSSLTGIGIGLSFLLLGYLLSHSEPDEVRASAPRPPQLQPHPLPERPLEEPSAEASEESSEESLEEPLEESSAEPQLEEASEESSEESLEESLEEPSAGPLEESLEQPSTEQRIEQVGAELEREEDVSSESSQELQEVEPSSELE